MKVLKTQRNSKNCIICGMDNPLGLQAPFYILDDNSVASVFSFKLEHQSYPDRTHGGMIAALLDELMGRALWINEPDTFWRNHHYECYLPSSCSIRRKS